MVFELKSYVVPNTIDEAYETFLSSKANIILGGTTFLKFSSKKYQTAIDLSNLKLNSIKDNNDEITIGAYVTFGDIERSELLNEFAGAILVKSIKYIVGTQFRNSVTVGASVYSRYGFSDFLTALLVLNTEVSLHKAGRMPLETFLEEGSPKDILTHIHIKKNDLKTEFIQLRSTKTNFSLLNVAISKLDGEYKVAFGARPRRATIAKNTSEILSKAEVINKDVIDEVCKNIATDVEFGSNARASKAFREKLASNILKRAICNLEGIDEY